MNKTILSLFACACCVVLFSCDTPKDGRPSTKTSVDMVPPGTRNTSNITPVDLHDRTDKEEVMPDRDLGENVLGGSNEAAVEDALTNDADSVENH